MISGPIISIVNNDHQKKSRTNAVQTNMHSTSSSIISLPKVKLVKRAVAADDEDSSSDQITNNRNKKARSGDRLKARAMMNATVENPAKIYLGTASTSKQT